MKRNVPIARQESLVVPDVQNPFVHRLHFGILDKIQIVIMSVTVAPLRLLMSGMCLVLAWPLAALSLAFRTEEEKRKPLTGWRKAFSGLLLWLGRCVIFIAGFHKIKFRGKPASAQDAPVLCAAPHSTFFDTIVCFLGQELKSPVAKIESSSLPFLGTLIQFTQPVFVRREDPNSRAVTIQQIRERGQSGGAWPQVLIFPEGTCTNRSCLITFKPGAFYPGVPVQPVCLRYFNKLDTFTWTWDGPKAFACLWYTFCQFNNQVEIEFLPVYNPSEEEKNDARLFAHNVRAVMAKHLNCPVTDHTYDDCRLMVRAARLKLPMEAGLVEFQKLHQKLGVNSKQMQGYLEKFCKIAKSGQINLEEFASYLHLPKSQALEEVFALYDRDNSGTIDFREYVIGLSLVSGPANSNDTVQFAFQLFDTENQGHISREGFTQILCNAFKMNTQDVQVLFDKVDCDNDDKISFDEFKAYAEEKPEYAKLFKTYHELVQGNGHVENNGTPPKAKFD
ncbi:lysophosphatidylcholine acyltransferase 2-like isoform X1 [Haliotis rufescens]|uniref:lysophosphatidylcholine acyltransferase 2-like isoform X1 n=1 Tax=Haliotis rufescens TaxID=6454 RepID=UPI00201ED1B1|nr:lysophosphatidylcholine acyltransferase 2-like isoform X1 [Haliotis rufescens]XP_048253839.1 lysophosphatidylcholine acyltransferase 2-like isoform X1 [Haliotis rufescens]